MEKLYIIVSYENKDEAKKLGAKFDWDKKLWYGNNININELCKKYKKYTPLYNILGENREYGGSKLYIDLIPRQSWANNVRNCISDDDWLIIRKYAYERVNYVCECCGIDCKNTDSYNTKNINNVDDNEFMKWNTVRLEAHERWSYNNDTLIQKLERIIALCHRCHSVTHFGLTQIRGLDIESVEHLMIVNNWNEEKVNAHKSEQIKIWRERNEIKWELDLSIITNSGFKLNEEINISHPKTPFVSELYE